MARKTNTNINGKDYFRVTKTIGKKLNNNGIWVDDRKQFYGKSKAEAEEKARQYMETISQGMSISSKCIGEIIDEWIDSVFMHSTLADSTKKLYIRTYQKYFRSADISGLSPSVIEPLNLQTYYNTLEASDSCKKAIDKLLKRFFKYAEVTGICKNIAASVEIPLTSKIDNTDIDVWEDDDLKMLISLLDGEWYEAEHITINGQNSVITHKNHGARLRFLVILAANTGARISELLALTYDDIKDGNLIINKQTSEIVLGKAEDSPIHITKPKSAASNRTIPLSDIVLAELEKHRARHMAEMMKNNYRTNLIFTTETGCYYYKSTVTVSLTRFYKRHNLPYHKFHSFRHTFGTNLSRAGVPIEEVRSLMGHTNIQTTAKYYINVSDDRKKDAIRKISCFSF